MIGPRNFEEISGFDDEEDGLIPRTFRYIFGQLDFCDLDQASDSNVAAREGKISLLKDQPKKLNTSSQ